jgi:hypothetical protein
MLTRKQILGRIRSLLDKKFEEQECWHDIPEDLFDEFVGIFTDMREYLFPKGYNNKNQVQIMCYDAMQHSMPYLALMNNTNGEYTSDESQIKAIEDSVEAAEFNMESCFEAWKQEKHILDIYKRAKDA